VLQDGLVRPVGGGQEHRVDVRIVAATHRDLRDLIAVRRFRQDLYYRLAVVEIPVPPLRERLDDIPLLAEHLLGRLRAETGLVPSPLEASAIEKLSGHRWPGNVRELEAVLARALLRAGGRPITADDVQLPAPPRPAWRSPDGALERDWVATALAEAGGNVTRAAARIGWSRQKLYRRLKALGLPRRIEDQGTRSGGSGSTSSSSSTFQ
jgi:DNA-binding NtrC family response regulator